MSSKSVTLQMWMFSCSTCESGVWNCASDPCGATCSATGDPHIISLDKKNYDFMGICTYYMLSAEDYSVVVDTEACGKDRATRASCTRTIYVEMGDTRVSLKQDNVVEINGKQVRHLPFSNKDFIVYLASSTTIKVCFFIRLFGGAQYPHCKIMKQSVHQFQ